MNNYERYVKYMTIQIGNAAAACGMAGNVKDEAGRDFNPGKMERCWQKRRNLTDEKYVNTINDDTYRKYMWDGTQYKKATWKNDNTREAFGSDYIGFGLSQITWESRKLSLYDFAKEYCAKHNKKFDISDFEMQLDFTLFELTKRNPNLLAILSTGTDIRQNAILFCTEYERPLGYETARVQNTRAAYAMLAFKDIFKGKSVCWFQYFDDWYFIQNFKLVKNSFIQHEGCLYYLIDSGKMATNCELTINGKVYKFDKNGRLVV